MKNSGWIIGCVLLAVVLGGFVIHFKQQLQSISKDLEAERYNRLVAEEKVVNNASKIKQLENDLKSSEDKIAKVQAVLKDQKSLNTDLERQYDRLTKAKADLENQLKIAIAQPSSTPVVQMAENAATQDTAVAQASK